MSSQNRGDREIDIFVEQFISQLKRRQLSGSHAVALATAQLLLRFVSAARWNHIDSLVKDIRALGVRLVQTAPKEIACRNIVSRVLTLIREEQHGHKSENGGLSGSMLGLLEKNDKKEEVLDKAALRQANRDIRPYIIEGIQDLIDEVANIEENIAKMSVDEIHDNQIILTPTPASETVLLFLLKAARKRNFTVLVTEGFPNQIDAAHNMVQKLKKAGVEAIVIPDAAVYAVMSKVGRVIMGTSTVLANGGCLSSAGSALVCATATQHSTPVVVLTAIYKLSPVYPFDVPSMIEIGSSAQVADYSDSEIVEGFQVFNPLADYVPPEDIQIYNTNIGEFSPAFIYRIVLDHYSDAGNL
ncbi:Translation initiation factor eIF-2B subunit beta [Yarrowia sp. B02]|nr:Translation initiation factor eIF-2B subunit beta [Yarrowia sp. B02]